MKILECTSLFKKYGRNEVISDLSFSIGKGEVLGLLGPNGAGKTTTIKMILGLTSVDRGKVQLKEGVHIGYSPETPYFHSFLTGYEVMRFYSRLQKISKSEAEKQIGELLETAGIANAMDKKVKTYSKGMLQRLAMAQALLGDPEFLILDEPTSGLDALGRIEMIQLIRKLKQKGKSILFNSHILGDVEKVADRTVFIVNGRNAGEAEKQGNRSIDLEKLFMKAVGGVEHDSADHEYIQ